MDDLTFPKRERLKHTRDIREVFASRSRHAVAGMRVGVKLNSLTYNRVLFAPSRGYGNAVERNQAKRICREVYRHIRHKLITGFDLVFICYPPQCDFARRKAQLTELCEKAGILRPTGE